MARDREKNVYIVVGLPKDSLVHRALLAEASNTGVSLGKLIPVKLYEYYTGQTNSHIVPIAAAEEKKPTTEAELNALAFLENEQ